MDILLTVGAAFIGCNLEQHPATDYQGLPDSTG
jgi:hypothetical protein